MTPITASLFGLGRIIKVAIAFSSLLLLSYVAMAQFEPASPPIANPADKRFLGVHEDWTSPALSTSNLKPARPLVAYINHFPGYTVELLQMQWRPADPLDLYVMKPDGVSKPPVIIYLYSFPEDTDRFKDPEFQKAATRDGFAAVGFVSALTGHRYHDRPMREWFISELPEALATSAHDVQMVIDYLASRDDLDIGRLGMYANGSGASIAILASSVDPRIKVLDTLNPWGDWPAWLATSPFVPDDERADYVTPEFLYKVTSLEPVNWLPRIQAEKFRLQEESFETNTPKLVKEKLRAAAPANATIVVYKTPADINAVILEKKELAWMQREIRSTGDSKALVQNRKQE